MPFARNGGVRIHFEVSGSGRPLLLLLGLGVSIADAAPFVAALAERFAVIAVDNRGAGLSDKPDEPYSIPVLAEDVAAVAEAAGVVPVDVLGYSLGGRIALQLALDRPSAVRSLVLLATGARPPERRRSLLMAVAPYLPVGPMPRQPAFAFRRQRAASRGYDARGRLAEVRAPTLVLAGRPDTVATPALAEELRAGIRGSRLEGFPGGHRAPLTSARAVVADRVAAFLAEVG
ncbi:alpha/beta fold hydrolase [Leifsonia shinshuensis]